MTYCPLINAGIIQKPKLNSSRTRVFKDKSELCSVCKLGHCDPVKHKLLPALILGHSDIFDIVKLYLT